MRFLAQNATIWLQGSTRTRWPESLYSAPVMIPSTHVAGFKRWAREGGEWEGRKGSKIKREARWVRKGWEGWERKGGKVNRGKWGEASLPQQFSKVGAYRARRPTGQCQGPADDHGHVLCLRYVSVAPQHMPLECSICWTGKFIVLYIYIYILLLLLFLPSVVKIPRVKSSKIIIIFFNPRIIIIIIIIINFIIFYYKFYYYYYYYFLYIFNFLYPW